MKLTVTKPVEIEATHIIVSVPIRYGTEDVPEDLPFRKGDQWEVTVHIDTGRVMDWPKGRAEIVDMKVVDQGFYTLVNQVTGETLAKIEEDYVPGCIPGRYGDYIEFAIDEDGVVKDWSEYCTAEEIRDSFFGEDN